MLDPVRGMTLEGFWLQVEFALGEAARMKRERDKAGAGGSGGGGGSVTFDDPEDEVFRSWFERHGVRGHVPRTTMAEMGEALGIKPVEVGA